VEQVAAYCRQYRVDVLLVAGDLFSELARPDTVHAAVAHLSQTFRPFLLDGGTIVAVTGNHDSEVFCQTLRRAFQLAAPTDARHGDLLPGGRFYLAVQPTHFRLADRSGQLVQLVCLPYPTAVRYAGTAKLRQVDTDQRNRVLGHAYRDQLRRIADRLDAKLPRILATHINVVEADWSHLFRLSRQDDIMIHAEAFSDTWSYVALGHLHCPQRIGRDGRVRYSGSIERLDMGERDDRKGVILLDVRPLGLYGSPRLLPLEVTPFYDVKIRDARVELPLLAQRYPAAARALVRCHIRYRPGDDNLHEILTELSRIFPRCYERSWTATRSWAHTLNPPPQRVSPVHGAIREPLAEPNIAIQDGQPSMARMVLDYLENQLAVDDPDRSELLQLARQLLEERE
jgi:exonuclease SbcD